MTCCLDYTFSQLYKLVKKKKNYEQEILLILKQKNQYNLTEGPVTQLDQLGVVKPAKPAVNFSV